MDYVKRLTLLVLFFMFFWDKEIYAVPGELNYQFNQQGNPVVEKTTVITDTKALAECNRIKMEIAAACQKSNSQLLEKVKETQQNANRYKVLSLTAGLLAFIFMMLFFIGLTKKRGSPPPPSTTTV